MRLNTGPQTDAGKAVTSQNARTHGLSAKVLVVSPDDHDEFDQLHANLLDECRPEGAIEEELFRQIVHAQWNLRRCDVNERKIFEETGVDPATCSDEAIQRRLDRIQRYRTAHHRVWHRAFRELRALQTNRLLANPSAENVPLADQLRVMRYLDAHSRIKARNTNAERSQADAEFKQWWNLQERSLAESAAAADAEIAARKAAPEDAGRAAANPVAEAA